MSRAEQCFALACKGVPKDGRTTTPFSLPPLIDHPSAESIQWHRIDSNRLETCRPIPNGRFYSIPLLSLSQTAGRQQAESIDRRFTVSRPFRTTAKDLDKFCKYRNTNVTLRTRSCRRIAARLGEGSHRIALSSPHSHSHVIGIDNEGKEGDEMRTSHDHRELMRGIIGYSSFQEEEGEDKCLGLPSSEFRFCCCSNRRRQWRLVPLRSRYCHLLTSTISLCCLSVSRTAQFLSSR